MEYVEDFTKVSLDDEDHVLIRVASAALNPIDGLRNRGYLRFMVSDKHPHIFGYDVSGIVEEIGPQVTTLAVGDRVYSRIPVGPSGTLAEYVSVKDIYVAKAPTAAIPLSDCAAIPLCGLTVLQVFEAGNLQKGQTVFISRGAGGIGTLAIQMAKHVYGAARVITTASADKVELLKELGADEVIDYTKVDFRRVVKNVDFAFDVSNQPFAHAAITKRSGFVASLRGIPTPESILETFNYKPPFWMSKILRVANIAAKGGARAYGVRYQAISSRASGKDLVTIAGFIENGKIRPVIDSVFELKDARQAMLKLEEGHATGKIVISVAALD